MRARLETFPAPAPADTLAARLRHRPGFVYLRTGQFDVASARHSLLAADPVLVFRSLGSHGEIHRGGRREAIFGDPWRILGRLLGEFEQPDEADAPFPLGAAIGYWGYELRQFLEPRVGRRAVHDLAIPDCQVGFHGSLAVYDHQHDAITVVATGVGSDGRRTERRQEQQLRAWRQRLFAPPGPPDPRAAPPHPGRLAAVSLGRADFLARVCQAQQYIRQGDIYQVNLAQRLQLDGIPPAWELFQRWCARSPAPFGLFLDAGDFALLSASPELFLRLSGTHALTRPIKGTRPRSPDPARDAQLTGELRRSEKEMAELVMITDL
ncbi:MAG: chorismate-binding protein, partial [Verrucomicrobiota bacterium]